MLLSTLLSQKYFAFLLIVRNAVQIEGFACLSSSTILQTLFSVIIKTMRCINNILGFFLLPPIIFLRNLGKSDIEYCITTSSFTFNKTCLITSLFSNNGAICFNEDVVEGIASCSLFYYKNVGRKF